MAGVLHIQLGLQIRVYALRWLAVVSDCTGARVENDTRPARHKPAHTWASHMPTSLHPHTHVTIGYVRHVVHAARRSKTHLWLLGLEDAKFSHHEKSYNWHILSGLSSPNGLNTIDRRRIHTRAWIHSFHRECSQQVSKPVSVYWRIAFRYLRDDRGRGFRPAIGGAVGEWEECAFNFYANVCGANKLPDTEVQRNPKKEYLNK